MMKKLVCLVVVMVLANAAQALVWSDNFDHAMDNDWNRINYQGWYEQNVLVPFGYPATYPGGPWTIGDWDGYMSMPDADTGISPTMIAHNFVDTINYGDNKWTADPVQPWYPGYEGEVFNGVLRVSSSGSGWSDTWNTGAFLFKMVEAESFAAQVQVVSTDNWWHNLGGLMARAPGDGLLDVGGKYAEVGSTGANENWVYLTYFPLYGVGNHIRNTINGASTESGIKGYPCDPYLKLVGIYGDSWTFYFYTSPDGTNWTSLPGLEGGVIRDDLPSMLEVGIFTANYTGDWIGNMDFDNFSIIPEPATVALLGLGGLALIRRKRS
jgi:hypothetical protein